MNATPWRHATSRRVDGGGRDRRERLRQEGANITSAKENVMTTLTRLPLTALFLAASLTAAGAQDTTGHEAHHPTGAAAPASETAAPAQPGSQGGTTQMGKASGGMQMMDMNKMMGGGMGQMMDMMGAMSAGRDEWGMMPFAHTEGQIAFLKTELEITDAQLPQWNAFADALRASTTGMRKAMANVMKSGTLTRAPARADAMVQMMTAGLESTKTMAAATNALYMALSDSQRAMADELLSVPMMGMGPMLGMGSMSGMGPVSGMGGQTK
jgi:hypothetical protein